MKAWLLRIFTHDLGRKLLALFFALVLFDVLDKKVQADDRLAVQIVYADQSELERVPEVPDRTSELIVAERGAGRPRVVASLERPAVLTLKLHAAKDALERVKSHRHRFVYRLGNEGIVTPTASELDGMDALIAELGPGATVEIAPPIQWSVDVEDATPFTPGPDDLALHGSPAPGYDARSRATIFRPAELELIGPKGALADALRDRKELFEAVVLDGSTREVTQDVRLAPRWRDRLLRLGDARGGELSALRVSLKFERRMTPVPAPDGDFELPVHVICNDDILKRRDDQKSWRDGWRLTFDKAVAGELKLGLKILAPETMVGASTLDRAKLGVAKEQVELVVRAHDAAGVERTTIAVAIQKFADFPEDLDVVFADGTRRANAEVTWQRPDARGDDREKEKASGHDGN